MARFQFDIAKPDDDEALCGVLAATPMPGRVAVSFRREPSFLQGAVVEGPFHQAVIARDRHTAQVVGFGCRSIRNRYVNGRPSPIGYLSSLRLLPEYRGSGIVANAYRYLRTLHDDGRTPLYLTTIAEGNEAALSVLTCGRAGLPRYHFAGGYRTLAIPVGRVKRHRPRAPAGMEVREATYEDLTQIVQFLSAAGPARQFFPQYAACDFFGSHGTFRDLTPQNLLLAFRHGRAVGTLACWNQCRFRQTVVEAYGGHLRWTRPLCNGWAGLRGLPKLPQPGHPFPHLAAALPVVQDDDVSVFTVLLESLLGRAAEQLAGSRAYLLVGLHEDDPLLPVARRYTWHSYRTRLYYVCWEDGETLRAELDDRPPYLELGCL